MALVPGDVKARLVGFDNWFTAAAKAGAVYDDDRITGEVLPAAIRRFEREAQYRVNQVQVVTHPDGLYASAGAVTGDTSLTTGTPDASVTLSVLEDSPYPYFETDGREFFKTTLLHRPVTSVQRFRLMWNTADVIYTVPNDWISLNKRTGRVWLLPVRGQAVISGATIAFAQISMTFGQKGYIPGLLAFDYIAGLPTDWDARVEYGDIRRCVTECAALMILEDIAHTYDAGVNTKSIGSDLGISQSVQYSRFLDRKKELDTRIEAFKATLTAQETPILLGAL